MVKVVCLSVNNLLVIQLTDTLYVCLYYVYMSCLITYLFNIQFYCMCVKAWLRVQKFLFSEESFVVAIFLKREFNKHETASRSL